MKLSLTLSILLLFAGGVWGEMKTIKEYFDGLDNVDRASRLYLNHRCLGLHDMFMTFNIGTEQETEIISLTKELTNMAAINWVLLNDAKSFEDEDKGWEAFQENLKISVPPITNNYRIEANNNMINNGSYIVGSELLMGDMHHCGVMIKEYRSSGVEKFYNPE